MLRHLMPIHEAPGRRLPDVPEQRRGEVIGLPLVAPGEACVGVQPEVMCALEEPASDGAGDHPAPSLVVQPLGSRDNAVRLHRPEDIEGPRTHLQPGGSRCRFGTRHASVNIAPDRTESSADMAWSP